MRTALPAVACHSGHGLQVRQVRAWVLPLSLNACVWEACLACLDFSFPTGKITLDQLHRIFMDQDSQGSIQHRAWRVAATVLQLRELKQTTVYSGHKHFRCGQKQRGSFKWEAFYILQMQSPGFVTLKTQWLSEWNFPSPSVTYHEAERYEGLPFIQVIEEWAPIRVSVQGPADSVIDSPGFPLLLVDNP